MNNETKGRDNAPIDFCTLGMFIIDEIHPPPSSSDQTIQTNIIGGAGTYSAIGARLLSPPPQSQLIGWIVDAGHDFPEALHQTLASWQTNVLIRARTAGEPTTRGWNGYSGNEHRAFKYLTPKRRLTADDLTPTLLAAKSFHLICGPQRCIEQVQRILARRREAFGPDCARPIVVWEPVPDLCIPSEAQAHFEALQHIDVVSPNHDELGALFDFSHGPAIDASTVERHARELLDHGIGRMEQGAVVVRCGAQGCYVLSKTARCWLPAYHTDSSRVKDPTGGGNGFLGGLAVGLVRSGMDVIEAARWGSVAASYCIEQVGMPKLLNKDGRELWNETNPGERLNEFRKYTAR